MASFREFMRRELARAADKDCPECHGEGIVTYTARNRDGEVEVTCACVDLTDRDDQPEEVVH